MARKIITNISTKQLNQTIDELHQYAQRLADKCELFVNELADIGIEVARANLTPLVNDTDGHTLDLSSLVVFTKEVSFDTETATCIILPESHVFINEWETGEALVDPLLMYEFGSGRYAVEGHRGTFPNQKYAFDPKGWFWKDIGGVTHRSFGIQPTRPLFKAKEEMVNQIHEVAVRVFSE